MTHNDADKSLADDSAATLRLGTLPVQAEEPPPPLVRVKRRKLPIATLALGLAAACGIGFYSGVRVEKGQIDNTSASSRAGANFAFGGTGAAAAARNGATPSPSAGSTATGGNGGNGAAGAGGFGGAGGATTDGGSANIIGTVSVVDGSTLYITETSGDTVKVTTSDGTTVTKTDTGTVKDLAPGESVVIRGVQSSQGVYAAQSVTQGSAATAGGFGGGFGGARGGSGRGGASTTPSPSAAAAG